MARASTLTSAEVRLIKAMLLLTPKPNDQVILSYFTRPDRDLNHRVISQINAGHLWGAETPASEAEARAYMAVGNHHRIKSAEVFVNTGYRGTASSPLLEGMLNLNWWPVGQGLFASGMIAGIGREPMTWVYDCGTSSSRTHLTSSLNSFARQQAGYGVGRIQLAALSHFDRDHLNGLVDLIKLFPIRTLLLPYVAPWRRLLIAVDLGVEAEDPDFGFFLDPIAYLSAVAGDRIQEIVWVQASGPDDLPIDADEVPGPPLEGPALDGVFIEVEEGDPPQEYSNDPSAISSPSTRVRFLRPGRRLVYAPLWEFVPYNDGELAPKVDRGFMLAVEALREKFLQQPSARTKALADLKALYKSRFTTDVERNQISLFLYSGPLSERVRFKSCPLCPPSKPSSLQSFSQMHTGDGYLTLGPRYDAFESFFKIQNRLSRSAFLQVMHHGSRANWHPGIAAKLAPQWSIFSSNPAHKAYGHPHAEVLRDFWCYRPTQVDKHHGFSFHGYVEVS